MKYHIVMSLFLLQNFIFFKSTIHAENITVTTSKDLGAQDASSGPETSEGTVAFRSALEYANHPASDTDNSIFFNIPKSDLIPIALKKPLDPIVKPIIIDGYSQSGSSMASQDEPAHIAIEINGEGAGNGAHGLVFEKGATGSVLRGVSIYGFDKHGLVIKNSGRHIITGNYVGINHAHEVAKPNGGNGIHVVAGSDIFIGGQTPDLRNIISGNALHGISLVSSYRSHIMGNYVGTDDVSKEAIANGLSGINLLMCSQNIIGGERAMANVISGNHSSGVMLQDSSYNSIVANYIGCDVTGTLGLGNMGSGILISHGSNENVIGSLDAENIISANGLSGITIVGSVKNKIIANGIGVDKTHEHVLANKQHGIQIKDGSLFTMIGGSKLSEQNIIGGNAQHGIMIQESQESVVQGNCIGASRAYKPLPNGMNGILIKNGSKTYIGGEDQACGNIIWHNSSFAIEVDGGTQNLLTSNSLFKNGRSWAIQLINNGNNNQAAPRLIKGSSNVIQGILESHPNEPFQIQVYNSLTEENRKEGNVLVASFEIKTDERGNGSFEYLPSHAGIIHMTATRLVTHDTSRFSNGVKTGVKEGVYVKRHEDTFIKGQRMYEYTFEVSVQGAHDDIVIFKEYIPENTTFSSIEQIAGPTFALKTPDQAEGGLIEGRSNNCKPSDVAIFQVKVCPIIEKQIDQKEIEPASIIAEPKKIRIKLPVTRSGGDDQAAFDESQNVQSRIIDSDIRALDAVPGGPVMSVLSLAIKKKYCSM